MYICICAPPVFTWKGLVCVSLLLLLGDGLVNIFLRQQVRTSLEELLDMCAYGSVFFLLLLGKDVATQ
jgi:hypothetical protein